MEAILQKLVIGVQIGSVYALVALGYTMVYGVLRLINFAHSDVFMVGAFIAYYVGNALKIGPQTSYPMALLVLLPVLAASIVGCGFLGFAIERLAYKPLRRSSRLSALITAIGISLFLENAAQLLFGANPKFFRDGGAVTPRGAQSTFTLFGAILSKDQLVLVIAAAIMMTGLWYIVQRTKTGRAMRAVAHDYDAAALMGINVDSVISFTFALGAALAGAAGMLFVAFSPVKVDPLIGVMIGLKAFVAAVVGGIGSIPGAVLGGLLMGISESFIRSSKFSGWTDAVAFSLLIVVLLLRPAGILGKFAPEKV